MKQHSETAWRIASLFSDVLASSTRDLAAHIDTALEAERSKNEDTVYGAYLGLCVLRTICKKSGWTLAEQRTKEILVDLGTAFPHFAGRTALRNHDEESKRG